MLTEIDKFLPRVQSTHLGTVIVLKLFLAGKEACYIQQYHHFEELQSRTEELKVLGKGGKSLADLYNTSLL